MYIYIETWILSSNPIIGSSAFDFLQYKNVKVARITSGFNGNNSKIFTIIKLIVLNSRQRKANFELIT